MSIPQASRSQPSSNKNTSILYYSDDSDEDNLPYPTELSRADFLHDDFDAQTYLSTLRNRHQTLEDLRTDLRERSQLLSRELLELVNGHYEEFLSLGDNLHGGEERVEGVRVGVLAFEREVQGVWTGVKERETLLKGLLEERKGIREGALLGRALLEVGERADDLESRLGLKSSDDVEELEDDAEDESGSDDFEEGVESPGETAMKSQIRKLQRHTRDYLLISRMCTRIGTSHPFLLGLRPRMNELRKTILLDLASALRQAKASKASVATLDIVKMYGDLGAESESIRVLRGS